MLESVAPDRPSVDDAFRVHGERVLYNSVCTIQTPSRNAALPKDHRFVGPLVRNERLPDEFATWSQRVDDRPQVYVALGTILSHRGDVLTRIAEALRHLGLRAALASGATPRSKLGHIPANWGGRPQLPTGRNVGQFRSRPAPRRKQHGARGPRRWLPPGGPTVLDRSVSNASDLDELDQRACCHRTTRPQRSWRARSTSV